MRKGIAIITTTAIIVIGIMALIFNSASVQRGLKDIRSDFGNGLNRTVTVYTADGKVLKAYKGKIDLASTEGGIVKFDLDGKRIMYYNCYVEVLEEEE